MALIPITLQTAMGAAFQAGVLAMEVKAKQNLYTTQFKKKERPKSQMNTSQTIGFVRYEGI